MMYQAFFVVVNKSCNYVLTGVLSYLSEYNLEDSRIELMEDLKEIYKDGIIKIYDVIRLYEDEI